MERACTYVHAPDFNSIEEAFSKVKALVRKEGARVREALVEAIGRALVAVTTEDAVGWFAHAGLRINPYECCCQSLNASKPSPKAFEGGDPTREIHAVSLAS
jgi:hypothetical protein